MAIKCIELGLQGGGAHGAFTWGVLDRLLADRRLEIKGISGTSAGAMNAVVLADGLQRDGRRGAQRALHDLWRAVSDAARFSPVQRTPLDRWLGRWTLSASPGYWLFDWLTRVVSPYDFNPFDINPLRDILAKQVDFDCVHDCDQLKLFISATNVRTGRAKIFRRDEITLDAVMASTCLPHLYKAVEIDGEAYWDGGYLGNPALFPLIDESDAQDIIIVQVNPIVRAEIPRTAPAILNRLNEITFNSSLIAEVASIMLLKQIVDQEGLNRPRVANSRLHRISAEKELAELDVSSKLNGEWAFLKHLHEVGYQEADRWLAQNFERLGKESTLDASSIHLPEVGGRRQVTAAPLLKRAAM